jgi:Tol biopolymer transport system component
MVVDIESGQVHQLTSTPQSVSQPAWSPDGRWIATITGQKGVQTVDLIDAITGEQQSLAVIEGSTNSWAGILPRWSSDGHWLAVFTDYYLNNTSSVPRTYIVDVVNRSLPFNYFEFQTGFLWQP